MSLPATSGQSKLLPSYQPSWAGLCRALAWCLVFLWVFGAFLPPLTEDVPMAGDSRVIPLLTIYDDHRTVRGDYVPDPLKRHIVWISDSAAFIAAQGRELTALRPDEYTTVPQTVAKALQKKHPGLAFDSPVYLRLGMRSIDELIFALQAARDKPDLIVLSVNQVWTFSHYQIAHDTSFNLAPGLLAEKPGLWHFIPLFCRPVQNLWALLGSRFPVLRDASPLKRVLEDRYAGESAGASRAEVLRLHGTDVGFWLNHRMMPAGSSLPQDPEGIYAQVINHNAPGAESSFATDSFNDLLEVLQQSGVPVLIYDSPIADYFYSLPETARKIHATEDFLAGKATELSGTRIRIIGKLPEDVRKSMLFQKDGYHPYEPGKLSSFLADQIWLMLDKPATKLRNSP